MIEGSHHIVPLKHYVAVLVALLCFTVLTVAVAKPATGFDVGHWNTALAMAISSVKAGLVAAIFMHLKYDSKVYLAIFVISLFFMAVLFAFCAIDIFARVNELSTL